MLTPCGISGGDNKLAVIMGAYKLPSAVQCRGTFEPMASCQDVLQDMPATTEKETFGPSTDQTAKVLLPQGVESGKRVDQSICSVLRFLSDT